MIIIHYEVYVLEGRGWMLHARFPSQEREDAILEAKELEAHVSLRVRVVRETYDTKTNRFEELEIYRTQGAPPANQRPAAAVAAVSGGGRVGAGASGAARSPAARPVGRVAARPAAKPVSTAAATAVVVRLCLILLFSVAMGLVALRVVPYIVRFLYDYGFRVTPDTYSEILIAVFFGVVLLIAVPLGLRFLPSHATLTGAGRPGRPPPAAPPSSRPARPFAPTLAEDPGSGIVIPETWGDDPPAPEPDAPPADLPAEAAGGAPLWDEAARLPEPEPAAPEPEAWPTPEPSAPPALAADESDPWGDHPADAEESAARAQAERFLDGAVKAVKAVAPTLDQYNRFALTLYMAGAAETLGDRRRLGAEAQVRMLKAVVERMGSSPDVAARVHDKLGDYMTEPRYMRLIQAGRSGMEALEDGDAAGAHTALAETLKDWNKPAAAADRKPSIITVMFTDMVGSTDMTQVRGDVGAQEIVRRHNAIVRGSLGAHSGREVKHTGDGIMASFGSAANAVLAAVEIQRQVAAHNQRLPGQPLRLRIGLNAGEPIQEEDDLFGTTVQLAARVCGATQPDQVLCTTVVKDLASGKSAAFAPAGAFALKGFRDKVPLWEVAWR